MLNILFLNTQEVVFAGEAESVILPGERGTFEVLSFHKTILSRLLSGSIVIDEHTFSIQRGIVKVQNNNVTIISES